MRLFSKLFIFAIFAVIPQVSFAFSFANLQSEATSTASSVTLGTGWREIFGDGCAPNGPCFNGGGQSVSTYALYLENISGTTQNLIISLQSAVGGELCTSTTLNLPAYSIDYYVISCSATLASDTFIVYNGNANIKMYGKTYTGTYYGMWLSQDHTFTPFVQFDFTPPSPPIDTTTRFDFTVPANATTTATSTSIGAQIYINPTDYVDDMYLEMSFFNQTYFGASAPSVYETVYGDKFIKIPITASSTILDLATSTVFTLLGDTNAVYRISRPTTWWEAIINFFTLSDTGYTTVLETRFKFTVSAKTSLDILYDENVATLEAFSTSTSTPITNCGITTFNLADCAVSLVIPNGQIMKNDITNLRTMVLTHAPIGYVTRFIDIVTSTSTAPLPIVTITFTPDSPMQPYPTTFDMGDMFTGGADLLNSVTDPNTGKNAHDIFLPLVQGGVALAVLLTIISDILKMQGHSDRSKKYT